LSAASAAPPPRVPKLDPTEELLGARLDRHLDVLEAEHAVDLVRHRDEGVELLLELVRRAVDVRVVLRERTHAREPLQRARRLEAMEAAEVGVADRQVAIRVLRRRVRGSNAPGSSSA
jgi:hypothetical protein